jgi:hypothetical protein
VEDARRRWQDCVHFGHPGGSAVIQEADIPAFRTADRDGWICDFLPSIKLGQFQTFKNYVSALMYVDLRQDNQFIFQLGKSL